MSLLSQNLKLMAMICAVMIFSACNNAVSLLPQSEQSTASGPSGNGFSQKSVGIFIANVDSEPFPSIQELERLFPLYKSMGINTIYPVIWNKGQALYSSKVLLDTFPGVRSFGRDVLADTISVAKKVGDMKVIPWFEYGLKYPYATGTDSNFKITEFALQMQAKPGWVSQDYRGKKSLSCEYGYCMGFMNPNSPQVVSFLSDMFREVLDNYEVDGILVDDHFSLHNTFGYTPDLLEAFHQRFPGSGSEQPDWKDDARWRDFRSKRVADALSTLSSVVRSKGKAFVLSPGGGIMFALKWLQNWRNLVHEQKLDGLIVQSYRRTLKDFQSFVENPENLIKVSQSKQPTGLALLTGLSGEQIETDVIRSQVEFTKKLGYSVHFFYNGTLLRPSSKETSDSRMRTIGEALQSSN